MDHITSCFSYSFIKRFCPSLCCLSCCRHCCWCSGVSRSKNRTVKPNNSSNGVPTKVIVRRIGSSRHLDNNYCYNNDGAEEEGSADPTAGGTTAAAAAEGIGGGGGVTNFSFEGDDDHQIIFVPPPGEDLSNHIEHEPSPEAPVQRRQKKYEKYSSSIFLNTGPRKCIHVIHVKTKPPPPVVTSATATTTNSSTPNSSSIFLQVPPATEEGETELHSMSSGTEDEDEYWFSKWSKKPKLKNPFVSSPPAAPATAVPPSRTGRGSIISRSSRSSSVRHPSIPTNAATTTSSPPPPPIPENGCPLEEESPIVEKLGFPAEHYVRRRASSPAIDEIINVSESVSPEQVHLDIDLGERDMIVASGFTNLAYQPAPGDDEDDVKEEEERKPAKFVLLLRTDDSQRSLSPPTSPPPPVPDLVESTTTTTTTNFDTDMLNKTDDNTSTTETTDDKTCEEESQLNSINNRSDKNNTTTSTNNIHHRNSNSNSNNHISTDKPKSPLPPPPPPLLFFIHGISGSTDIWSNQLDSFHSNGYELILVDLLGHGLSSSPNKPKYYTFESLLEDLVYIYDYFIPPPDKREQQELASTGTLKRPTVLVGHGYGALLATVLSRVRPSNVSLLILISGGGPIPLAPPGTLHPPTLIPFQFQLTNIFTKKRTVGRLDPLDLKHILPTHIHQYLVDGQIWLDCDTSFHHRIIVPTLLVYGLRDTTVSLIEECEMEKAIPKAYLELIPTAGHLIMKDEPKKLNRMILKFLQSWLP